MSLLGDALGLFFANRSDRRTNRLSREQLETDRELTERQIEISRYIEELARSVAGLNGDFYNASGGSAVYNPETGRYEVRMGPQAQRIQNASDEEELARYTGDQRLRREGLEDSERMRERSVGEADTALSNALAFQRGVGRVDPSRIASQLRTDRTGAVNAGYDDAAKAAQTLQMRTGNSAVGDALSALARDRARAIATTAGSPDVEALGIANELNQGKQSQLFDIYQMFGNEGRSFYDAGFGPSTRAAEADAQLADRMKFDLSKYDLAMGGSGNAASTIGRAQALGQNAFQNFMGNRVANPTGRLIGGIDEMFDRLARTMASGGMGGMGGGGGGF
jgi:hypothetical protein